MTDTKGDLTLMVSGDEIEHLLDACNIAYTTLLTQVSVCTTIEDFDRAIELNKRADEVQQLYAQAMDLIAVHACTQNDIMRGHEQAQANLNIELWG